MKNKIELYNIKLQGKTPATQLNKVIEEHKEVLQAYVEFVKTGDDTHLKEELIDSIQACYTMLRVLGVKDTDFEKHNKKISEYVKIGRV